MNLYEFEGKQMFAKYGIGIPKGVVLRRGQDLSNVYEMLGIKDVVVKAQVLSGKRGKNNAIRFCSSIEEVENAVADLFNMDVRGQYVASVLIEEKLDILEEHYLSITYDTNKKQPVLVYSQEGGMDIEEVPKDKIQKILLDIRHVDLLQKDQSELKELPFNLLSSQVFGVAQKLWDCFLAQDARLVEINPLVKVEGGQWFAADSKIAVDDDAFFRHKEWSEFEPRTMMGRIPTERELSVKKIDEGEEYYRGTAGKYIEMDGDIAVLFSGGGASIANMDELSKSGLRAANYTEYSGNPPQEKVYELSKIVLSKPGLRGLWIAGGVSNFTDVAATFAGIIQALDEVKPTYPIVVRRAGLNEKEGMRLMRECAVRNNLNVKFFGKEVPMGETAITLASIVQS